MTPEPPEPAPRYERFTLTYPSRPMLTLFYAGGVALREVQVTYPRAEVEAVEDSRVEPSSSA